MLYRVLLCALLQAALQQICMLTWLHGHEALQHGVPPREQHCRAAGHLCGRALLLSALHAAPEGSHQRMHRSSCAKHEEAQQLRLDLASLACLQLACACSTKSV